MLNFVVRRASLAAIFSVLIVIPSLVHAGIFSWLTGSSRRSAGESKEQWYAARSADPTGTRQRYINGKLWPPQPRPTGDPQLNSHTYHAAHYWPYPYPCEDRHFVRDFSKREVNNGWIKATTLYDYHFDNDTHGLNRAGRIQLRWILQNAAKNHRFAFVQTAMNTKASQFRVGSVQYGSDRDGGPEQRAADHAASDDTTGPAGDRSGPHSSKRVGIDANSTHY